MKKIKKIKSGFLSRNLSLGKMALKAGKNILFEKDQNILESLIHNQLDKVVNELGLMKGSVTKAGQMLSLFGEAFLPEQARNILKKLENQTYFLDWDEISKNIPMSILNKLEIEKEPVAAASLGQVHRGVIKEGRTSKKIALKIQYRGIEKAIDNDLKVLKVLFSALKIIPKEINIDDLFIELKEMLLREIDYIQEADATIKYRKLVGDHLSIYIPKVYKKYSSSQIICTEWIDALSVRDQKVQKISQKRRNHLSIVFFDLFFKELFEWGFMQTDAHFGNFLITLDTKNGDRWNCLDFGAHKNLNGEFIDRYKQMIQSIILKQPKKYFEVIESFGINLDQKKRRDFLWDYCKIVAIPFEDKKYEWGDSEIPQELLKRIPQMMKEFSGGIPFDGFFIDRKIAGVFFMMKHLRANINAREVFEAYIDTSL